MLPLDGSGGWQSHRPPLRAQIVLAIGMAYNSINVREFSRLGAKR